MTPDWKKQPETIAFYNLIGQAVAETSEAILGIGNNQSLTISEQFKYYQGMLEAYLQVQKQMEKVPDAIEEKLEAL